MAERPEGEKALKKEFKKGAWSKVTRTVWRDERFLALPERGKFLWLYLLTTDHMTMIPGLSVLHEGTIAGDLGWSIALVRKQLDDLRAKGLAIQEDKRNGLIWLPRAIRHNVPDSPNHIVGWANSMSGKLPACELLRVALADIRKYLSECLKDAGPFLAAVDLASAKLFGGTIPPNHPPQPWGGTIPPNPGVEPSPPNPPP